MVHHLDQEPVQVEEVAGDQDRQDLSPSVGQEPVAAGYPTSDDKRRARRFTLDDNIRTGSEALFPLAHRLEHPDVAIRQRRESQKPGHEGGCAPSVTPGSRCPFGAHPLAIRSPPRELPTVSMVAREPLLSRQSRNQTG